MFSTMARMKASMRSTLEAGPNIGWSWTGAGWNGGDIGRSAVFVAFHDWITKENWGGSYVKPNR
jgi:hypothetical protein